MNIALFLSADGIAMAHRQAAGHWAMIGETSLDVADLGAALNGLRQEAVTREGDGFETLLVLPDDQMLYTSLTAPTADPEMTAFRIEEGLDGMTPYAVTELEYDWRMLEEDRVKIAVVARETLDEARNFAAQYGFDAAGFAAMPPMERFPGVPTFGVADGATDMDFPADGIAFGPDTHGQPVEEPEPQAVEPDPSSDAPTVEQTPDASATAPSAEDQPAEADAPTAELTPDTTSPPPTAEDDPAPAVDADENPALAEALAISDAPPVADTPADTQSENDDAASDPLPQIDDVSMPVQPIAADPEPAAEPVTDTDEDPLPPAPSPAAREARQRARIIRGEAPGSAPKVADGGEPQFSARRGRATSTDAPRESLVGQRSARIGLAPGDSAPEGGPTSGSTAGMPRLAEQLQRVREASKTRPKAAPGPAKPPRPRVEIEPRPPSEAAPATLGGRPSPFDGPAPSSQPAVSDDEGGRVRKGLLGGALRGRGGGAATGAAATGGLLRRRAAPDEASDTAPEGDVVAEDETFATGLLARKSVPSAGPSFRTGLILTLVLLILLAIVAIWSAVFLPNSAVARLFGLGDPVQTAAAPDPVGTPAPDAVTTAPAIGALPAPSLEDEAAADGIDLAALPEVDETPVADTPVADDVLPDIDAELDLPPLPPIDQGQNPSVEEAEALYAQDGIWARSPERPDLQPFDLLDRIYTASIDPQIAALDAVALPDPGVNPGELLRRFPSPPAFGTEFDLTPQGLVAATRGGVLTPEGAFVVAGTPPVFARQRPREIAEPAPAADVDTAILGSFRPVERPANLAELRERQVLGGLTQTELGERRPTERPQSPQEAAAAASLFPGDSDDPDAASAPTVIAPGGTDLAVARSLVPATRPSNISQIVASAVRQPAEPTTAVAVEVAAVAPGPSIPSNADVSRAATQRNEIRLRNVNLIGVTGTSSDRRALVRLSSGRFVRVGVGDRLDGGRVAAIGETTLQYVRNGRTLTLEIPG